jgi:hypothetical protein
MGNTGNNEKGNKIMVYAPTSYNRTVCASPPYGGTGYEKPQSAQAPFCGFFPPHFFVPVKMLRIFPHRAQKNVAYSRNVKRHFLPQIYLRKRHPWRMKFT